jgi:hypothetical protein
MKFRLPNKFTHSPEHMLRRAGYFYIFDQNSQQGSFIKKLTDQRYPRFHLYITENPTEIIFDLHLDQSVTRLTGQTAHRADYESEEVKQELTKIYHAVNSFKN